MIIGADLMYDSGDSFNELMAVLTELLDRVSVSGGCNGCALLCFPRRRESVEREYLACLEEKFDVSTLDVRKLSYGCEREMAMVRLCRRNQIQAGKS